MGPGGDLERSDLTGVAGREHATTHHRGRTADHDVRRRPTEDPSRQEIAHLQQVDLGFDGVWSISR
jgi:hypothetical protein